MSLIAYDYGIGGGADTAAASLMLIAIEVHLKSLLGDILSLVRADRSSAGPAGRSADVEAGAVSQPIAEAHADGMQTSVEAAEDGAPGLFAPAMEKRSSSSRTSRSDPELHGVSNRFRDFKALGLAPPLQTQEFANLWDISPHAFVQAHPPALEWLTATRTPSEPSDDETDDETARVVGTDKTGSYSKGLFGKDDRFSKVGSGMSPSSTPKMANARLADAASAGKDASSPPKGPTTPGAASKNIHKLRVSLPPPPAFSPSEAPAAPAANGVEVTAPKKPRGEPATAL